MSSPCSPNPDLSGRFFPTTAGPDARTARQQLAKEAIEQGKDYYGRWPFSKPNNVYRENTMTMNFVREFELLAGESVMGIYGNDHVGLDGMDPYTDTVPCMANQLKSLYGGTVHSQSLAGINPDIDPLRIDDIEVGGKHYEAPYFGRQELTGIADLTYRDVWRLENAYDDFKNKPKTRDYLPFSNYPMALDEGQVFVIDYGHTDGSVTRAYYRADGNLIEGEPATEEFTLA